jgi:ABC-2 type transport system permease protein
MVAILKREFRGYFTSAVGYVFLAVFYFFAAYFFCLDNLASNSTNVSNLFNSMVIIFVIIIPVLTMRLLCEEKKQKTDQLLLTSPISLSGMVMGKFLAALAVFAIGLASMVVFGLTMAVYVNVDTFVIFGNIIGTLLLASAMISIGLFISSLTENQVVSAIASVAVLFVLFLIGSLSSAITNTFLQALVSALSISSRYTNFAMGIFNLGDAVYYFSIAAVFIFLTVRMLEKRRWG